MKERKRIEPNQVVLKFLIRFIQLPTEKSLMQESATVITNYTLFNAFNRVLSATYRRLLSVENSSSHGK